MKKNPKSPANEKDSYRDLITFEQLPENTKYLMKLKDEDERTDGPEQAEIADKIRKQDSKS